MRVLAHKERKRGSGRDRKGKKVGGDKGVRGALAKGLDRQNGGPWYGKATIEKIYNLDKKERKRGRRVRGR